MAVSLLYLSCVHLHRQIYDYGSYTLDITGKLIGGGLSPICGLVARATMLCFTDIGVLAAGPLMVITQKVTSLAFSLHDGLACRDEDLTKSRKYYAVR